MSYGSKGGKGSKSGGSSMSYNNNNIDNMQKLVRRNSVHELPSQLEHQIDQKMKRRLRRMKIEDTGDTAIDTAAAAVRRKKKSATKNINMQLTEKFGAKGGNNDVEECANNNIGSRESNDATKSHQVGEQHNGASNCGQSDTSDENTSRLQQEDVTFALQQFTFQNDDESNNCSSSSNDYQEVDSSTTNNKCQTMNTSSSSLLLQRRATDCSEDTLLVRNISDDCQEVVVDYDHQDHDVRVNEYCKKEEDIDWEEVFIGGD